MFDWHLCTMSWAILFIFISSILTLFFKLQQSRQQFRETDKQLQLFIETVQDYSIYLCDLNGHITHWNSGGEAIFGWKAEEIIGKRFDVLYTEHDRIAQKAVNYMALCKLKGHLELEAWRQRKDHSVFYASVMVRLLKDKNGNPYGFAGITRDITERLNLEREILTAREEEQARIGRQLHDGLAQQLVGITYAHKALQQALAKDHATEAAEAERIGSMLSEAMQQAKNLSRGVYPTEFMRQDLTTGLTDMLEELERRSGVTCRLVCEEPLSLKDRLIESHLFLIAQEAARNAVRHGQPKYVRVELHGGEEQLTMTITDDGPGLRNDPTNSSGIGMKIMNHRARTIGAVLDISEKDGGGVAVTCVVPRESMKRVT